MFLNISFCVGLLTVYVEEELGHGWVFVSSGSNVTRGRLLSDVCCAHRCLCWNCGVHAEFVALWISVCVCKLFFFFFYISRTTSLVRPWVQAIWHFYLIPGWNSQGSVVSFPSLVSFVLSFTCRILFVLLPTLTTLLKDLERYFQTSGGPRNWQLLDPGPICQQTRSMSVQHDQRLEIANDGGLKRVLEKSTFIYWRHGRILIGTALKTLKLHWKCKK